MAFVQRSKLVPLSCFTAALMLLAGCGGSTNPDPPTLAPLSANNVNLIFVVSEDLAFQAAGDMNAETANLTPRGLQRALRMGTFLQRQVLGMQNATAIYTVVPTTHPQTVNSYPDMVGLETIQQFAMLNRITLSYGTNSPIAANSYPLGVSYSLARLPDGVAPPLTACPNSSGLPPYTCQGLDFRDLDGANEALVGDIIKANASGFFVFSAPWETVSSLLANINRTHGYSLPVPTEYAGPNMIYAVSVSPSGSARLNTYDSKINPPAVYPILPSGGVVRASCRPEATNTTFHMQVTGGVGGAVVPAGINTNETVYLVRHAEAHPASWWEDGNYLGAGQWRALNLPNALRGKINPAVVYSIDPAQVTPGSNSTVGDYYSYVRTNLTVLPYAIANGLPYNLATGFEMAAQNPPHLATDASNFFFTGGKFSNQRLLVGWSTITFRPPSMHCWRPITAGKLCPIGRTTTLTPSGQSGLMPTET